MNPAPQKSSYDIAIVGGGIVGLATALAIVQRHPRRSLCVLEKESAVAQHQTGNNSGVIHSGLYYKPGSKKAQTCVEGARRMLEFCKEHQIAHNICGKIVVATSEAELPALAELLRRGTANQVPGIEEIGPERIREIEPHATGIKGLWVPGTGIVDYPAVARKYVELIRQSGSEVLTGQRVTGANLRADETWTVKAGAVELNAKTLINCAGLHSDRVARAAGAKPPGKIVPFRGEYYKLRPESEHLVRGLIYPVPDPRFPFLGVHFTRMIPQGVEAGPNAVLALKREGYTRLSFNFADTAETLSYRGFQRMAMRYWKTGLGEVVRSFSKSAFVRALQKLIPEIQSKDLIAGGAGVRAQALLPDGSLVDDFLIVKQPQAIHVLNAPSPAATASLTIGEEIAAMIP